MRIQITHTASYTYAEPPRRVLQMLRLTPRDHEGQHVMHWRIEPNVDGRMRGMEDPYGNIVHDFSVDGPIAALTLRIEGEVETTDLAGIVRGAVERAPPLVFLRDTPLTEADDTIRSYAESHRRGAVLDQLHALMQGLHDDMAHTKGLSRDPFSAKKAFADKGGSCGDIAHVFVTCARHLDIPARFVSGYVAPLGEALPITGTRSWAEAYVPDYGWIGFDPALNLCPQAAHVRVAVGLDGMEAAPVRGARSGGEGEALFVNMSIETSGQ
ncbi:MAG: transglutaminase family protein [Bosea sp. (in: a-proteobacteria)]